MQEQKPTDAHMVRADLLAAIAFVVLGGTVVWLSWEMPRLATRGIHPATAPGLVPGMLGIALTVCGVILGARSLRVAKDGAGWSAFAGLFTTPEAGRVATAMALALVYAVGLVGWMPFWAATAVFVIAFIIVFEHGFAASPHPLWRTILTAVVQGVIVAIAVTLVFERGFLVRLP